MLVLIVILVKWCSGMPICEAFAQIEQQPNIYDVVHVKHFDEVCFQNAKCCIYVVYVVVMEWKIVQNISFSMHIGFSMHGSSL